MGLGGRPLLTIGLILMAVGFLLAAGSFFGIGRLPGDFVFKKGGTTIYFPLATSILLSILLSFLLNLFFRKP